jgi:hypothetical protein
VVARHLGVLEPEGAFAPDDDLVIDVEELAGLWSPQTLHTTLAGR